MASLESLQTPATNVYASRPPPKKQQQSFRIYPRKNGHISIKYMSGMCTLLCTSTTYTIHMCMYMLGSYVLCGDDDDGFDHVAATSEQISSLVCIDFTQN